MYCVLIGGEAQWEFKVEQFWGTFMTLGYLRWCNFILLRNIKDKYRLLLHYVGVCCSCVADKDLTCKRRNCIFGAVIGGLAWQRSTTTERISNTPPRGVSVQEFNFFFAGSDPKGFGKRLQWVMTGSQNNRGKKYSTYFLKENNSNKYYNTNMSITYVFTFKSLMRTYLFRTAVNFWLCCFYCITIFECHKNNINI